MNEEIKKEDLKKEGFFSKMMAKIDKKLEEKASNCSCCSSSGCSDASKDEEDKGSCC